MKNEEIWEVSGLMDIVAISIVVWFGDWDGKSND